MAMHFVNLSPMAIGEAVNCGMSATVTKVDNTTVLVSWKGTEEQIAVSSPVIGVDCCGDFPEVIVPQIPQRKDRALLWACGISREYRFDTLEAAKEAILDRREKFTEEIAWRNAMYNLCASSYIGCQLFVTEEPKYLVATSDRSDCGGWLPVAYWISPKMTRAEAEEFLNTYGNASRKWAFEEVLSKFK